MSPRTNAGGGTNATGAIVQPADDRQDQCHRGHQRARSNSGMEGWEGAVFVETRRGSQRCVKSQISFDIACFEADIGFL